MVSDPDPAPDERQHRQNRQRHHHHHRAFMRQAVPFVAMSMILRSTMGTNFGSAIVAQECHEPQPEHVERRDKCRDHADQP